MANIITIPSDAIIYDIDIDIFKPIDRPTVYAMQYDTRSRYIRATIWNNSQPYVLTTNDIITFDCTKPDGNGVDNECGIDANGNIIYEITEQTTTKDGRFEAEFRIYSTSTVEGVTISKRKATPKFNMWVEKSALPDGTIISAPEFNVLTNLINTVGDLVTDVNTATTNANNAAVSANTAATNAIDATNNANTATINANSAATLANEKAGSANTATTNANNAAVSANTAANNANTTNTNVTNAETLRVTAENTRGSNETARQSFYNAYKLLESYNPSTSYVIGNKVIYQGGTYQCILACKGVSPTYNTDNSNWKCIAAKGTDGAGSGDMKSVVYDPQNKSQDIFAYADSKLPKSNLQSSVSGQVLTSNGDGTADFKNTSSADGKFYEGKNYKINNPYKDGGSLSLKGQMHCHTTNSDGVNSPMELVTAYKNAGYDFITITDHNVITPDPTVSGIVWIGNSVEETYGRHVCAYDVDTRTTDTNTQDILNYHRKNIKMTNLPHPGWHSLYLIDKNEALGYYDFNFTEVFNAVTNTYGNTQWDYWLSVGKKTFALSTDDCHNISLAEQFNKGWVVVKANSNDKTSILDSLRKGNFYASSGNDISISLDGNTITASSTAKSNFSFIGLDGNVLLTTSNVLNCSYTIKGDEMYVRVVSEDASDTTKKAWSQPIFIDVIVDNERLLSESYIKANISGINRQALINGNFDIWRGTSLINPFVEYLADRWFVSNGLDGGTNPNITHSKQELTAGELNNVYNYYRMEFNGAGSGFGAGASYIFSQAIENGVKYLCGKGKQLTLSFYARSSIANKKIAINLVQQYDNVPLQEQVIGTNYTLTPTWKKYSFTFTTGSIDGKTIDSGNCLRLRFWLMWGTNFISRFGASAAEDFVGAGFVDIAQVQLCAGNVELAFNPNSYVNELASCQRYNKRLTANADYSAFGSGQCISTTQAYIYIPFNTQMRINPSLTTGGNFALLKADGTYQAITTISIHKTGRDSLYIIATVSGGLVAGNSTMLVANNDLNAYLNFNADFM